MLIGLLSDSHGQVRSTQHAVAALKDAGAEVLLHLGDIETVEVLDELVGHNARLVFGNCDWDAVNLARYAEHVGIAVDHPAGRIVIEGRTILYTHGHLEQLMQEALADGVDYLIHGHTHAIRDEMIDRTRVINPGALFRAQRYTAALLDPVADRLSLLTIDKT